MRLFWILLPLMGFGTVAGAQAPTVAPTANQTANGGKIEGTPSPSVEAFLDLDGALSSKVAAGKEFKLLSEKPIKLPDGKILPRLTPFHGIVVQASAHSKALPNGALLLKIDEARPKNETPIPLTVTIDDVGQSFDDDAPQAKKDDKKKDDGSTAKKGSDATTQTGHQTAFKKTQIDGAFLAPSDKGSGILVAPGAELYLDHPTVLSVTITEIPAKAP